MYTRHNNTLAQASRLGVKISTSPGGMNEMNQDSTFNAGEDSLMSNGKTPRDADKSFHKPRDTSIQGSKKNHIDISRSIELYSQGKITMRTQFSKEPSTRATERTNVLAMPRPTYHGKDFF